MAWMSCKMMEDLLKEGHNASQRKSTLMENITVYTRESQGKALIMMMMTKIRSTMMIISNTLRREGLILRKRPFINYSTTMMRTIKMKTREMWSLNFK
jgi:hypothetical protein